MSKKSVIRIVAAAIAVAIIAVCLFVFKPFSNEKEDPNNGSKDSITAVQSPKPEVSESSKPTPDPNIKKPEGPKREEGQVGTGKLNPDSVKTVDGFNGQEIAEAISFVNDYATLSLSNKYFIGGDWEKDGFPVDKVQRAASEFYSNDLIKKLDGADKLVGEEFINSVMPYTFYLGDNGYSSPSKYCSTDKKEIGQEIGKLCPVEGVEVSDIQYASKGSAETGYSLGVEFSATADIPININENNTDGLVTVNYDYKLLLDRNIQSGKVKYEITSYDTSYSIKNAREVKND